jgi:uncharacterized protein YicC (UPF0701 family)
LGGTMALPEMAHMIEPCRGHCLRHPHDVAEEVTRLSRILTKFDRPLAAGGELGNGWTSGFRSCNWPEANTTPRLQINISEPHAVSVDMKVLIEQIREQVQNIE